jgi:hypothetical protein
VEAMPSTNSVALTSYSPYELTINNTIENRKHNVQPIAIHENQKKAPISEVSPRDLLISPFAVWMLISILRRSSLPHVPLQNL